MTRPASELKAVLEFALTQGPYAADVIAACLMTRRAIPEPFEKAPELLPGLDFYMDAFNDLINERSPVRYGKQAEIMSPIERRSIREWLDEHSITDTDLRDRTYNHVRTLDKVFRDHVAGLIPEKTDTDG